MRNEIEYTTEEMIQAVSDDVVEIKVYIATDDGDESVDFFGKPKEIVYEAVAYTKEELVTCIKRVQKLFKGKIKSNQYLDFQIFGKPFIDEDDLPRQPFTWAICYNNDDLVHLKDITWNQLEVLNV